MDVKAESYSAAISSRMYEKSSPAGTVELAGNGSGQSGSMYSVSVIERQGLAPAPDAGEEEGTNKRGA